jgi:hypothetical protein
LKADRGSARVKKRIKTQGERSRMSDVERFSR